MKWLRLWTEILDDPKMCQLADDEYRVFTYLLAMAAEEEKDGAIPFKPGDIAWRTRLPMDLVTRSIDKLLKLDIIGPNGNGLKFVHWDKRQFKSDNRTQYFNEWYEKKKASKTSNVEVNVGTNVGSNHVEQNRAEQNRDISMSPEVTKTPKGISSVCGSNGTTPHGAIVSLYHEILPELPAVKEWTAERQKQLQARWREAPKRQDLEWWKKYFYHVRESNFLMGKNKEKWTPNLEWLVRKSNLVNVIEGKYHGRTT